MHELLARRGRPAVRAVMLICWTISVLPAWVSAGERTDRSSLVVVVMDPLSAPLACDCVQGYAQRKYAQLGSFLERELNCKVQVVWSEALDTALSKQTHGRVDLVIGKDSVVRSDARNAKVPLLAVARLTDKKGLTTQTGLFVVRAADPALTVGDLRGYRFLLGPAESEEKSAAALRLLKKVGIAVPNKYETYEACSEAASKLLELDSSVRATAVISSYAQPLLEGCGTIQRGDLRVIGITDPVPFVTAFVRRNLPDERRRAIADALLRVDRHPGLLAALESRSGFVAVPPSPEKKND